MWLCLHDVCAVDVKMISASEPLVVAVAAASNFLLWGTIDAGDGTFFRQTTALKFAEPVHPTAVAFDPSGENLFLVSGDGYLWALEFNASQTTGQLSVSPLLPSYIPPYRVFGHSMALWPLLSSASSLTIAGQTSTTAVPLLLNLLSDSLRSIQASTDTGLQALAVVPGDPPGKQPPMNPPSTHRLSFSDLRTYLHEREFHHFNRSIRPDAL